MGIQCLIFFVKFKFSSICELNSYDTVTTKKQSFFIKSEECSFFCFLYIVNKADGNIYRQMYGKHKN